VISFVADAGGTRIKLALMRDGTVLAQDCIAAHSGEGLAPQLPRIEQGLDALCRTAGISRGECAVFAMAFPSLIDPATHRVVAAYGKYPDAPQLDLTRWSLETLGLPLLIENDARMALLGEWQAGAGRGSNDLVMVTLGTGVGTAALIEGRVVRGKHGQSGVLGGHLTVQQNGRRCVCGNRGCVEAEASTFALPALAADAPDFSRSALRHAEKIDFPTVFHLARDADACAVSLKSRAIEVWSSLIVNMIHAYDPERIIVGGGIAAGAAEFLPELERGVLDRAHTPWGRVSIVLGELGDAAALFGGDYLSRRRMSPGTVPGR
jgi:glucokinase